MEGFHCSSFGRYHDSLPFAYATDAPDILSTLSADQRKTRSILTDDVCVIDEEHFFVRGNIELPVIDHDSVFAWGVWVSLSKANFERCQALWNTPGRENEPPYFGWLCTNLSIYPSTLHLKTHVHTRAVGQRPFIELEATDHPLALEQRNGVTLDRVRQIAEQVLHGAV